jgi:hypothetical protein
VTEIAHVYTSSVGHGHTGAGVKDGNYGKDRNYGKDGKEGKEGTPEGDQRTEGDTTEETATAGAELERSVFCFCIIHLCTASLSRKF